ncbi:PREDICTED: uncharacterized protein LOC105460996 [Wasmannia auropunctata]|uniref:uncharacterized protein LOC105460996 n=1 Tax=Wasmannia auropunctata TaxID=64793 RepID=UPI0005EE6A9D|nr:PREDICTED: uncharacterized protein LOC105460996 [Wasmannia auropunctata]
MIGFLHTALNFVFCRINGHHIQNVTAEMEHFSNFMQPHEEIIIQRHIDSCIPFYGMSMFIFYFTTISTIIIKPAMSNQTFPTIAEYPFDVYYQPLKAIIYIHQSIVGLIMAAQLCTNIFMALLLWFASARFEILIERIRKITNVYQLFKCIKKHQELLNYARKVATVAGPFAFLSTCCSTIGLITVFLLWVTNQPIITIILSFGLVLISLTEVFMYIWPAEYLIYTSEDVGQAVFDMLEHNYFIGIWKYLQIIIMRSQKPVNVSIPCLLPALSYHYFTSYLSTVLSYFTTLRIMMTDDKN